MVVRRRRVRFRIGDFGGRGEKRLRMRVRELLQVLLGSSIDAGKLTFLLRQTSSNTTNLLLRHLILVVSLSKLRSSSPLVPVCLLRRVWPCLVQVAAVQPRSVEISSTVDASRSLEMDGIRWVDR